MNGSEHRSYSLRNRYGGYKIYGQSPPNSAVSTFRRCAEQRYMLHNDKIYITCTLRCTTTKSGYSAARPLAQWVGVVFPILSVLVLLSLLLVTSNKGTIMDGGATWWLIFVCLFNL